MREKGAALITVIMVLLVLTVLGMAFSLLMNQEDRMSGRQDLQKMALYAAEAGLRRGEQILAGTQPTNITGLLSSPSTQPQAWQETPTLPQHPDGTNLASWDRDHLGTYLRDGTVELANQEVPMAALVAVGKRAFYSVYIRDNPTEPNENPQDPLTNRDNRVRLVAVGWVASAGNPSLPFRARRVAAVRILEEEFGWETTGTQISAQDLFFESGTSSGIVGRIEIGGTP